ncbi:MAG: hypothetical protein AVDCRST_MAG45-634 [uncultured Solirubrobacterales bacterium]|uniref:Uncharacterized protein n=1 Tax=uncultured Solirubrobacterales bacterium TaxID=768556 RepID=A0A6J4S412_9ACTN|nr:MAG: hypothetical protein AVDCRST_MAG45-634 [uncultured Solirubrobacterales bacterium]
MEEKKPLQSLLTTFPSYLVDSMQRQWVTSSIRTTRPFRARKMSGAAPTTTVRGRAARMPDAPAAES